MHLYEVHEVCGMHNIYNVKEEERVEEIEGWTTRWTSGERGSLWKEIIDRFKLGEKGFNGMEKFFGFGFQNAWCIVVIEPEDDKTKFVHCHPVNWIATECNTF